MAARITMTPEELRDAATFLDKTKDDIIDKIKDVQSEVNDLTDTWEGAAQSAFFASFEELLPTLQNDFPSVLEGIAEQLRSAADAVEQVDEEVASALRG